jgi:hypothetical protein
MPVEWSLTEDVLTLRFLGEYTFAEIAAAARAGLESAPGSVRLLVDATGTARLPDAQGVRQRVDLLLELRSRLTGPVAIVASSGAMFGIARQIGQQVESFGGMQIRVFQDLAAARAWLADGSLKQPAGDLPH